LTGQGAKSRPVILWAAVGATAILAGLGAYIAARRRRPAAPAITAQQAVSLLRGVRFGKTSVDQEVDWLCHLLDGKSSGGIPFRRHQCQWKATRISPSLWRVEYDDRGVTQDGRESASDKIWVLDTAAWEIQPRTLSTLMITAPDLAGGIASKQELNDKFTTLTGHPLPERTSTLNQEVDTLPRWRLNRGGILTPP
jgi:hypothetical protein